MAAAFDLKKSKIPVWVFCFGFFGRAAAGFFDFLSFLGPASFYALVLYSFSLGISKVLKKEVLGKGDIYIIFILGLFLEFGGFLRAVFFSLLFALFMILFASLFVKIKKFPLAGAFLFGTLLALW